jgi:hypothetical protein
MAKNPQRRPTPRNWRTEQLTVTNGSITHDRQTITASQSTDGTGYYTIDTSGGAITLTMSTDDAVEGREINAKRDGSNTATIDTAGSATIDSSSSIDLNSDQQSVTLIYNSADDGWEIF